MKLRELLARELDVWPDKATHAIQEYVGEVGFTEDGKPGKAGDGWSVCALGADPDSHWLIEQSVTMSLADDYQTAIITRAAWQAERERIAGGWIAWGGGECPVDNGSLIDTQHRDGQERYGSVCGQYGNRTRHMFWSHDGDQAEVIAYRLHKPEQQQPQQEQEEMTPARTEYNPIHTRNRILEIDRTTEALEEERVQLVQRLADEGFVLARVDGKVAPETVDNLPRDQWRIGDLVVRVQEGGESAMPTGTPLPITYFDGTTGGRDVLVDGQFYPSVSSLIWHSRPTA